jgi:hypothetical protein
MLTGNDSFLPEVVAQDEKSRGWADITTLAIFAENDPTARLKKDRLHGRP